MPEDDIYVLLTDTGTLFTKMVKYFTLAPYNHASLVLDAQLNKMYSFGRKEATNPWLAGFVEENVYDGTFRHFPDTRCVLLRLKISQQQHAHITQIIQYFQQEKHAYRYNLVGLLFVLLKMDITYKKSFFCSQFVAEVLRMVNLNLWDRSSLFVSPHDFWLHPAFELVYEGKLYDYPLLDQAKLHQEKRLRFLLDA